MVGIVRPAHRGKCLAKKPLICTSTLFFSFCDTNANILIYFNKPLGNEAKM